MLKNNIDALILGCTHYGFLENKIKKIIGKNIEVISEGKIAAKKLREYLLKHPEIEKALGQSSKINFFTTDLTEEFEIMGSKFFGKKIVPQKAKIDK